MIDSYLRSPYQSLIITPILRWKKLSRISPSALTALSLIFGVSIPFCIYFSHTYLAILMLVLSGFFDTLDGSLARHLQKTTNRGAVFDIFSDRCVETAIILGIYFIDPSNNGLLSLGMLASSYLCITSFLVVGIFSENQTDKSFHYSPGIIERAEAFVFFAAILIMPSGFFYFALTYTTLVTITAFVRLYEFFTKGAC